MKRLLKKLASLLPKRWQQELKRIYFARHISSRRFRTPEQEYEILPSLVSEGDWVLDVGANIGHYSARLSELVGPRGRVIAFEPVPQTFELLAANMALQPIRNITLINAAASDTTAVVGMEIPTFEDDGLENLYTAHLCSTSAQLGVLTVAIDSLQLPQPVRMVKIDAEDHELSVLKGMKGLLQRDHPTLIVEDNSPELAEYLLGFDYLSGTCAGSSNRIFWARGQPSPLRDRPAHEPSRSAASAPASS